MAAPNYYQTGTLTLTSGSVDFTTSGSALQSAGIRDGDIILVKGFSLPIASIAGENAGTLLDPCPAAAAGNIPLRIAFQNDTQRYHAWAVWIRDKFSTGALAGLGALTGATDKLAYMTGASTWGTIDFKEWARTFLSAADTAAAQTALGATAIGKSLFIAANAAAVQAAAGMSTIGKALAVAADVAAAQDAIGLTTTGKGVGTAANADAAQTAIGGSTIGKAVFVAVDAPAARTAIGSNDAANLNTGTLPDARVSATLPADKAFRRGNIVGNVSQSGGAPTGAIIERATNANGSYVRYADGTQFCWQIITGTTAAGSVNFAAVNFPAAFIATPQINTEKYTGLPTRFFTAVGVVSATQVTISVGDNGGGGVSISVSYFAEGRWF